MKTLYEIASVLIEIFIILLSSVSVYHGIKYLTITKFKRKFDWLVLMQTIVSLLRALAFGYIVEEIIRLSPAASVGSFESLITSPIILLSSVTTTIWMFMRYKYEESGRDEEWNLQKI